MERMRENWLKSHQKKTCPERDEKFNKRVASRTARGPTPTSLAVEAQAYSP